METKTVVRFAATAAGFVPRPNAPLVDLIQGSGVSSAGTGWRRGKGRITTIEYDSVREALTV